MAYITHVCIWNQATGHSHENIKHFHHTLGKGQCFDCFHVRSIMFEFCVKCLKVNQYVSFFQTRSGMNMKMFLQSKLLSPRPVIMAIDMGSMVGTTAYKKNISLPAFQNLCVHT